MFLKTQGGSCAKRLVLVVLLLVGGNAMALSRDYSVTRNADGGYSLTITIEKRHWRFITAEGMFPKERKRFEVRLIGDGKDFSVRNQDGFYYSTDVVTVNPKAWDLGYVWIDRERERIYLNMYWIDAPNSLIPSDVNGYYRIKEE